MERTGTENLFQKHKLRTAYAAIAIGNMVAFYKWNRDLMDMAVHSATCDGDAFYVDLECRFVTEALLDARGLHGPERDTYWDPKQN